jgi:hypothetical protein
MAQRPTDPLPARDRIVREAARVATIGQAPRNMGFQPTGYTLPGNGTVPIDSGDQWLDGHVFLWDLDAVDDPAAFIDGVPSE